jgi:predicted phosphodiesterase
MRIGIISDIHGNLEAFEAVLQDMKLQKTDAIWCLGDNVGYGANPNECINLIKSNNVVCVKGNIEHATSVVFDSTDFNPHTDNGLAWTRWIITEENRVYIANLPLKIELGNFTLVHGSPKHPFDYITSLWEAEQAIPYLKTPFCLMGHSHIPMVVTFKDEKQKKIRHVKNRGRIALSNGISFINPGSVGQPRDGNPDSSYMIYDYDSNSVTNHRIEYDIATARQKIIDIGLPKWLGDRLLKGM